MNSKSTTYYIIDDIIEITYANLLNLKEAASKDPLKRARVCLHQNSSDLVHEMIIAYEGNSYNRPHKHMNKIESFHIIEGEVNVYHFDDFGNLTRKISMGILESGKTFIYRLNTKVWHTVEIVSDYAIIMETTTGPFVREETMYPSWAPLESDEDGIKRFLQTLKNF